MITWHLFNTCNFSEATSHIDTTRQSHPIPSPRHQTLLSKSIFEHFTDYPQIAAVALASKSIQNSSLAANLVHNITINEKSIQLFCEGAVFDPVSALSLQFVNSLHFSLPPAAISPEPFFPNVSLPVNWFISSKERDNATLLFVQFFRKLIYLYSSFSSSPSSQGYFLKSLQTLTLDQCDVPLSEFVNADQDDAAPPIVREFIALRKIEIIPTFKMRIAPEIINAFPNVSEVHVKIFDLPHSEYEYINEAMQIEKLVSLDVKSDVYFMDLYPLEHALEHPENLRSISLFCRGIRDGRISRFRRFEKLNSLAIKNVWLDDENDLMQFCSSFSDHRDRLRSLILCACSIADTGAKIIGETFVNLEYLSFENCTSIGDEALRSISSSSTTTTLRRLASLKLNGLNLITNNGMKYLENWASSLTELNVENCEALTNAGLIQICLTMHKLKKLNIGYNVNFSDDGFVHLGRLQQLTHLDADNCIAVAFGREIANPCLHDLMHVSFRSSEMGRYSAEAVALRIQNIVKSFPNLKRLDVGGSNMLEIVIPKSVAENICGLKKLEYLNFAFNNVSLEAVSALLSNLHLLKELRCRSIQGISRAFLTENLHHFRRLNCLTLSRRNLSDDNKTLLMTNCRNLTIIEKPGGDV